MEEKVIIELTPEEARRGLRSVKARRNYWATPEKMQESEYAKSIRDTYRDTARMIEVQMENQGVKP